MRNTVFWDGDVSGEPNALVFRSEKQPHIRLLLTCTYAPPDCFVPVERLLHIQFVREKVGIKFLKNEGKIPPNINERVPKENALHVICSLFRLNIS
jgi:hypothetical protein